MQCGRVVELAVSILTGLERPVQQRRSVYSPYSPRFQSSPALKDRCNQDVVPAAMENGEFQSSPALKDRCNEEPARFSRPGLDVSILTGLERPVQRAGTSPGQCASWRFQSSPALKDRCNDGNLRVRSSLSRVSILTGLERPVQRPVLGKVRSQPQSFNPHRP